MKRDGTCAETRFRLSPKRTSPFKSAGASVQSTTGSRVVRISGSNAGYTVFRGNVRVLATHSIRQFPLHFPTRASACAVKFQTHYTTDNAVQELLYEVHVSVEQSICTLRRLNTLENSSTRSTNFCMEYIYMGRAVA